ncbi:B3 domain-containing transcription repressor VAL2 isoform X3 [Rhododendron vialii]|uniref:B3 domain-containing transcription repressor VAL2 isoform X3 n=1 Tax=Rhododendron vialii TaxID=182163 RepID=UPI00265E2A39|nr:B3 domain-containing transcription repressor VAL2 isoform X3 [Rhododendron vialii]XP_058209509.1 B3 domain-containing transcription repressor VAL2 isoform X3 [Rhododendron vialii]
MSSRVCMNGLCGASSSSEWKKGWPLRSGEFANLCDNCGPVYEQLVFCDTFHTKDTGWRECSSCGKRLHCGCIASSSLLELLDSGGVKCVGCTRSSGLQPMSNDEKPKGISMSTTNGDGEMRLTSVDHQVDTSNGEINRKRLEKSEECNALKELLPTHIDFANGERTKEEEVFPSQAEVGNTSSSNFNQASDGSSESAKVDICRENMGIKDMYGSLAQTNLTIALASPSGIPNPFTGVVVEERNLGKTVSSFHQLSRSRHLLPKPHKSALATGLEINSSMGSHIRVARPPAEGRVKNQLLPRYWPRITDQELQLISGDSNSTIVPLFEKVLSASDAGRIGRLVLPKACAEAYFPPISQPEGLPLRIQDVKGKEWVFQFRFWPNNNSRMYVLEGVTPCIQSMQLQAGDTVTFSRRDPEGKLLMGFRKASNAMAMQSLKGSTDPHLNALSKHLNCGDFSWNILEKHGIDPKDGLQPTSMLVPERKKSRNIGLKSKRLLIDSQDALELKLTWEVAQDMLCPPLSEKPSIVSIEDHEFEEYEEPPVFGKSSIFTARSSGGQEQWTQCDSCSKWRRLPADFLLPPKWTCQHNIWDQNRCSCSAPDELNPRELENLLRMNKDFKKRRTATNHRSLQEHEPSDLEALANAALLGDNANDPTAGSVAATTKHPRHRPGCSCIVCIQPPSGKGKHKPTCTCIVCMTVKRRFKTLMTRKKKRQSEREAEVAQRNNHFIWGNSTTKDESEVDSTIRHHDALENNGIFPNEFQLGVQNNLDAIGKEQLDLNSDPEREGHFRHQGSTRVSMMSLLQVANQPLENYLKQNGLTSLVSEQQGSSGSQSLPQGTNGESEGRVHEDHNSVAAPVAQEENRDDELDQSQNDPS